MLYGIALFPDREVQQLANSYRKRYDPHYALIPPHITLKEKFEIENEEILQQMVEKIDEVVDALHPFTLNITKIGTFYPTNNTIYLSVENTPELKNLYQLLHEGILKTDRPYGFIPHITIGQKLTADELQDIYGSLKMTEFKTSTKVDRIHLLYQLDDGTWTTYQTFLFGRR